MLDLNNPGQRNVISLGSLIVIKSNYGIRGHGKAR